MRLTPSAAARLYGIHRATLYRHMQAGRLSWVLEPDDSRALDLSELIRCYGEPPGHATPNATPATPISDEGATPATERLLAELVELTRNQSQELRKLREEVASLRQLPAPSNSTPKETLVAEKDTDNDDDRHGLRAMAREIFKEKDKYKRR